MEIINLSYPHDLNKNGLPPTASAIGFFDGIHRGHQQVIKTATQYAQEHNMISAVMTFHPHPSVVLKNRKHDVQYITPLEEKKKIMKQLMVQRMYILTFNK